MCPKHMATKRSISGCVWSTNSSVIHFRLLSHKSTISTSLCAIKHRIFHVHVSSSILISKILYMSFQFDDSSLWPLQTFFVILIFDWLSNPKGLLSLVVYGISNFKKALLIVKVRQNCWVCSQIIEKVCPNTAWNWLPSLNVLRSQFSHPVSITKHKETTKNVYSSGSLSWVKTKSWISDF